LKTRGKLLSIIISCIILLSTSIIILVYYEFNKIITESVLDSNSKLSLKLIESEYPGQWAVNGDKLYKGSKLISGTTELVDEVSKCINVQSTIFLKDERVSTSILDNGSRVVGTKASEKVVKKVLNGGENFIGSVNIVNSKYSAIYSPIKNANNDIIGMYFIGVERSIIDKQINPVTLVIVELTLIILLVVIVLNTYLMQKIIIRPMLYIEDHLGILATGDLSVEVKEKYLSKKDEFGGMTRSIKNVQDAFRKMIGRIKEDSRNIEEQEEELRSISEEMTASSEEVASSTQNVSASTANQSTNLININEALSKFDRSIGIVIEEINSIGVSALDIDKTVNIGSSDMKVLTGSIKKVSISQEKLSDRLSELGNNINRINQMSTLINEIAEQTNLLALNASIEAARAGEAGKGFSVVAEEVRKLAEQSRDTSENISSIIETISIGKNEILDAAKNMNYEIDNQVVIIESSVNSFNNIEAAIKDITPKIEIMKNSSLDLNKEKKGILDSVSEVSSLSEEITVNSEEVANLAQSMSGSAEAVAETANKLNKRTKEIIKEIDDFKL
jgi:methyl-accepting chemotaxis protein